MDIAVAVSNTDHAASPYGSRRPSTGPVSPSLQAHRNLQTPFADLAPAHSPGRFHVPASRTSPAAAALEASDMDLSPTLAATQSDHHSIWQHVDSPPALPTPDGQDHDRMETDDDSHSSSSEDDLGDLQDTAQLQPNRAAQAPLQYDEVMDTAPDEPHDEHPNSQPQDGRFPPARSPGPPSTTSIGIQNPSEFDPPGTSQDTSIPHNHSASSEIGAPESPALAVPEPITTDRNPPQEIPHPADADTPQRSIPPPFEDLPATPPPPGNNNNQDNPERQQGRDDDSSQEESSDEEERPYWAEFVEDTSGPDERELESIEKDGNEVSALEHAHWESKTYEALEDPEHVPLDAGRITWTVTPVNGTPGNPNREKIMRSPAVLIGGLYWNIKYYPRGNDGTENMSVYIECSPSPRGGGDSDEDSTSDTSSETDHRAQASNGSQSANEVADVQSHRHTASGSPEVSQPAEEIHINSSEDRATTQRKHWEAAAQIGCVVYNPSEPRVHHFRRSSHRFIPDNADWGWTRFHGPWESIHLRQRNERQALLRNDTLVFTAYIRTVTDDTRALWWHAPKQAPSWDCYERIGVKSLATGSSRDNAIIAAISCWLHLKPFVDFIMGMKIPDALREPQERNRPLFHALQQLLEYMFEKPEDTGRNAMINVAKWIDWYITESYPPRLDMPDVVAVWESLRRILNYEASGMGNMATAPDCFQDVLLLRQPDPWATESPLSLDPYGYQPDAAAVPQASEPRSVQETIDLAASSSNPFRPWQCFSGNSPQSDELPAVLHIELHRQMYDKKARRWDKLTHRIQLNENITYTSPKTGMQCGYTLFGMVVHSGALESHDFNSIIRPHGPGTRWIRYSGGNFHREAACLTTTQAVTAHEGKGEQATGSAAVAYIVLYIRTDSVLDILLPPSPLQRCVTDGATLATASDEADSETPVSVRVYNSTLFDSHAGRGLPDLWALNSDEKPDMVREFHVPRSITLDQISRRLDSDFLELKKVTSEGSLINGWHYIETGLDTNRGLPRLVPLRSMGTVERAIVPSDGCRLWFHSWISKEPTDNTDTAVTSGDSSAETHQTHTGAQADVDEFADTVMSQEEQLELPARAEVSGAHNGVPDASASPIHETSALPAENVPPAHPSEQEQEHGRSEDAIMEGTQEPPAAADPDSPRVRTRSAHRIYFFVKVFDSQTQNLRAVCSHETFFDCNVHNSVLPLLGSDNTFDIYMERSRLLSEHDRVRSSSTFDDLDLSDGCIFIAHRRPSPEETAALVAQGKHPDPISYFTYLRYNDNPGWRASHNANNYFGTGYHSCDVSYGLFHGQGTMISTNGDAYVGNWVSNQRSGHGTMAYASGDTYIGDFAENEREGQGKMVYGKTKNVYEGGWKKGRRHGKGVMTYEVADEEMAMCKICYENETDALFYDCGHVVACEECARQVDVCPVCRKNVRGVCRIWKT